MTERTTEETCDPNQRRRRAPRRAIEPALGAVSFQPDAASVPAAHGGGPARRVDQRRQILAHAVAAHRRAFAAVAYRRGGAHARLFLGRDQRRELGRRQSAMDYRRVEISGALFRRSRASPLERVNPAAATAPLNLSAPAI